MPFLTKLASSANIGQSKDSTVPLQESQDGGTERGVY